MAMLDDRENTDDAGSYGDFGNSGNAGTDDNANGGSASGGSASDGDANDSAVSGSDWTAWSASGSAASGDSGDASADGGSVESGGHGDTGNVVDAFDVGGNGSDRNGEGRRRRRRRRIAGRDTGSDSERGTASENTRLPLETDSRVDAPNDVPFSRLSGERREAPANTRQLIQEGLEIGFQIPKFLGGGSHWPLDPDEAKLLAGRIDRFVASLPKRQANKYKKFIDKHLPGLSLIAAAATITVPRVLDTVEYRKHVRASQKFVNASVSDNAHTNGQRAANGNGGTPHVARYDTERSVAGASGRPLSRDEVDAFFAGDFG